MVLACRQCNMNLTDNGIKHVMVQTDKEGNGKGMWCYCSLKDLINLLETVSIDELLSILCPDNSFQQMFNAIDTNSDGRLSSHELKLDFVSLSNFVLSGKFRKFLKKKNITSDRQEAKSIYAMIDANKDGQISLEEFTRFCIDLNIAPQMITFS